MYQWVGKLPDTSFSRDCYPFFSCLILGLQARLFSLNNFFYHDYSSLMNYSLCSQVSYDPRSYERNLCNCV